MPVVQAVPCVLLSIYGPGPRCGAALYAGVLELHPTGSQEPVIKCS